MQSPECSSLAGFSEFRVFISEDRSVPKFPVSLSERVSASEFSDLVREYVAPVSECGSNFESSERSAGAAQYFPSHPHYFAVVL